MSPEATTCHTVCEMVRRDHYGERVVAHLRECDQCLDIALNSLLARRQDISVPPAFVSQVLVTVNASPMPAPPSWARRALWPGMVTVYALIAALSLPHLSALAESLSGIAVLGAAGVEISLTIVWVLGWNRPAVVFHR